MLAKISSAVFVHLSGFGRSFVMSMYRRMAVSSSRVLRCTPRRNCFSVSAANQRSTRFIHDSLVGVKST